MLHICKYIYTRIHIERETERERTGGGYVTYTYISRVKKERGYFTLIYEYTYIPIYVCI